MKQQPDLTVLGKKVKIYRASLLQSGTNAPVATIIQNDWTEVPVWSYSQVGEYRLTFNENLVRERTQCIIQGMYEQYLVVARWSFDNIVQVRTETAWSGTPSNNMLIYNIIEIVEYLT